MTHERDWNDIEALGHRVVAAVVLFACGFVTAMLTVCECQ